MAGRASSWSQGLRCQRLQALPVRSKGRGDPERAGASAAGREEPGTKAGPEGTPHPVTVGARLDAASLPRPTERLAGPPSRAAQCLVSVRDRRAAPRLLLCQLGPRRRQRGPGHLSWPRGGPWGRGRSTSPRLFSEKGTQAGAPKPATVSVSLLSLLLGSRFCRL